MYAITKKGTGRGRERLHPTSNPERLSTEYLLEQVQATIFEPHRREHVRCLFFEFNVGDDEYAKRSLIEGIVGFVPRISRAKVQQQEFQEFQTLRNSGEDFTKTKAEKDKLKTEVNPLICLYFSAQGVKKLMDEQDQLYPNDSAFDSGMDHFNIRGITKDPSRNAWEDGSWKSATTVDCMVLIAANTSGEIINTTTEVTDYFSTNCYAHLLFEENGNRLRNENDQAIEAFGFRDGLSQVPFWVDSMHKRLFRKQRRIVLDQHLGSYLVLRKLQQHRNIFDEEVKRIAELLLAESQTAGKTLEEQIAFVEAQLMGRFKDGTPLALYGSPQINIPNPSKAAIKRIAKFNRYRADHPENREQKYRDALGNCPFFAHTSKTNPRDIQLLKPDAQTYAGVKSFYLRIARRGIPYCVQNGQDEEQGMLFMGFQSSPSSQMNIKLRHWVHESKFPDRSLAVGIDPIIGKSNTPNISYEWLVDWGRPETVKIEANFQDITTFKGGEYFYAPSIKWLQALSYQLEKELEAY